MVKYLLSKYYLSERGFFKKIYKRKKALKETREKGKEEELSRIGEKQK